MSTIWYFAYGSNLQSATLRGRRGIEVFRSVAVRAPGWRLVFDKPGLLGHAAFANIVAEKGSAVLGAAFEITVDDHAHVELTEGVAIGNYRRVELAIEPLDASLPSAPATALSATGAALPLPRALFRQVRSEFADTPSSAATRLSGRPLLSSRLTAS